MNLIIDIGNSYAKAAIACDGHVNAEYRYPSLTEARAVELLECHPEVDAAILCAVGEYDKAIEHIFRERLTRFVVLDTTTPLPIKNGYSTPHTLGMDRLAAAVGAVALYGSDTTILVIDLGSAITIDTICRGTFLGGNISPGAKMRFNALHDYTAALPLCQLPQGDASFLGRSTTEAIEAGVAQGIIGEIESYIEQCSHTYGSMTTVFTGGDANYFAKRVKNTIFVNSRLVTLGLNIILESTR